MRNGGLCLESNPRRLKILKVFTVSVIIYVLQVVEQGVSVVDSLCLCNLHMKIYIREIEYDRKPLPRRTDMRDWAFHICAEGYIVHMWVTYFLVVLRT